MLLAQRLDRPGMGIAFLAHPVELEPQRFGHPLPRRASARPDQPADQRAEGQRGNDENYCGRVQPALPKRNEMRT